MPSTKITAAALAGALVTVVVALITAMTGVEVPATVAAALVTLASFGLGYFVKETNPAPSTGQSVTPPAG